MIKPVFRVVGLDHATCDSEYNGAETATVPTKLTVFRSDPEAEQSSTTTSSDVVTVRLKDILPALSQASANRLSWVRDFQDDPIVISKDLYEVLLRFQRLKRAG